MIEISMDRYLYKSNINRRYYLSKDFTYNKELNVSIFDNCMIKPITQCSPDGEMIVDVNDRSGGSDHQSINSTLNPVIYIGEFYTAHYGNFLIDYLSRIWFRDNDVHLVYVSKKLCIEKSASLMHILKYLHIPKNNLHRITESTLFSQVYVPERSMIHDRYVTEQYAQIYENIWKSIKECNDVSKIKTYDKIYVTRRKLKKHKEIGEYIFERFFKMNGFEVIAPETLSFEEQVCLFRNAKEIASIEGTHAHNIIFKGTSRDPYRQIILSKQSEVIPRQIQLNQITGGEAIWIDVYCEPFKGFPISHDRGPFLLKWNEQIELYAHDNHMILPKFRRVYAIPNMIIYICKCIGYWLKHNIKRVYLKIKSK